MKKPLYYILLTTVIVVMIACNSKQKKTSKQIDNEIVKIKDSIIYSFSFVGCNRVEYSDWHNDSATNASTANIAVLKRIFDDMSDLDRKPEMFFFLGDLVLAESDTINLDDQLKAWVSLYKDKAFSTLSNSGIELVAVPGNHEMLFYNETDGKEYPLKGATEIWMKYMKPYMPSDRNHITGNDSLVNQMTFSFIRDKIGFVVMNTDTYNPPTSQNPYGYEGMIPTQWIINQITQFKKDPKVEHIFVLGHKPYYVDGKPETGHKGFPEGPILWPELQKNKVIAMLSAHVHDYERMQPNGIGTYQIIAGNGGSKGPASFFGYSTINIFSNGEVQLITKGFKKGKPYYKAEPTKQWEVRDSTMLTWSANNNPYAKN